MKPRLLDLFCGAGGAAMGYHRAGFDVVGVDINPQPRFPFEFVQADAMEFSLAGFDAIHASPPCQHFTKYKNLRTDLPAKYPDLIAPMRERLQTSGIPWVMENVQGAPLVNPVTLCGSMFGLDVRRHRLFEMSDPPLMVPQCQHDWKRNRFPGGRSVQHGGNSRFPCRSTVEVGSWDIPLGVQQQAMGIEWMELEELSESIPPAYTQWLASHLIQHVRKEAA
jgi:DNA (cytosine-5)-methyltransferase 1